jgi:hypothetical protein
MDVHSSKCGMKGFDPTPYTHPPSVLPKYNLFPLMITVHTPKKSWFSRGFIFGEHRKGGV